MKALGIVMFLFGGVVALLGLFLISSTQDTASWTCNVQQGSTSSTCSYAVGTQTTDPNSGLVTANGGLAVVVVGAGLIAGGLACAGGASREGRPTAPTYGAYPTPGAQPHPGGDATFGTPGGPSAPPSYGQNR